LSHFEKDQGRGDFTPQLARARARAQPILSLYRYKKFTRNLTFSDGQNPSL